MKPDSVERRQILINLETETIADLDRAARLAGEPRLWIMRRCLRYGLAMMEADATVAAAAALEAARARSLAIE